ncbi:hypothetical protein JD969_01070 [Planctomycetota bacterium]|nr:hypothetical protein JD969_01070 [Planctomycetota bacterium]
MKEVIRKTCFLLVMILCCCCVDEGVLHAQVQVGSRRLIHFFTFEEREINNFEAMPQFWYETGREAQTAVQSFHLQPMHHEMMERKGYPIFNEVGFDKTNKISGDYSLAMKIKDGNAGVFLEVGAIPVVPNSDYLMTFNVRTEDLKRAYAKVRVFFIDPKGRRIEESVVESEPLRTQGEWTLVKLKLHGKFENAAYLGIAMDVEQPEMQADHLLGRRQIVLEDVKGGAWFDDIGVWQVPHIQVKTQSAVNVVKWPEKPKLNLQIRDLTGHRLRAEVRVYDYLLNEVASQKRIVGGGMPKSWSWDLKLNKLGWYLVEMRIYEQRFYREGSENVPVAWTRSAFLWAPETRMVVGAEGRRFAVLNDAANEENLMLVPEMLEQVGLKVLSMNVWEEEASPEKSNDRYRAIERAANRIYQSGGQVILSLDPLPNILSQSESLDAKQSLLLFQRDESLWRQHVAPMMMRLGQRISNWQIGVTSEPDAFYYDQLGTKINTARESLRTMVPSPNLIIPWGLDQSRPTDVNEKADVTYLLKVTDGIAPDQLEAYLKEWDDARTAYWLYFPSLDATKFRHKDRVADLTKRMVYGWKQNPEAMAIHEPWTKAAERRQALLPDPILGVFSQVSQLLAGRVVVEQLPLQKGMKGYVFDSSRGGMLTLWDELADGGERELAMYLGESPVLVDVWGNRTPLVPKGGKHHVKIGQVPVFIEGIDTKLAMFRAGFELEPSFIESKQRVHERTIVLKNPWNRTISGYLQIEKPESWKAEPVRHFFSIPSGQKNKLPVKLRFPLSETAGDKLLEAKFRFTADIDYVVDMATPMTVGLEGIDFSATLSLRPGIKEGTIDAVLVCLITNTGLEDVQLYAFSSLQGRRRQEVPVPKLMPGETLMRRFYFEDVGELIQKYPVRAGVREVDGPAVLNQRITYGSFE